MRLLALDAVGRGAAWVLSHSRVLTQRLEKKAVRGRLARTARRLLGEVGDTMAQVGMAPTLGRTDDLLRGAGTWPEGKPPPPGSTPFREVISTDEGTVILSGFITPKGTLVVAQIDTVGVDEAGGT